MTGIENGNKPKLEESYRMCIQPVDSMEKKYLKWP